ncbi:MAG: hypothetical protein IJZ10_04275, partial [Thermoguttaceae bacterium]|nr:hypothetical protein [Thermoguttaceae bacterium]
NDDRRPANARPAGSANDAPSNRRGSTVSRYPNAPDSSERRAEYVRYDERSARDADERRVYRTSFSGETLRF